jgi:O-antigen/teichoic acid export membrane protein
VGSALVLLLVASLCAFALMNIGPVLVKLLAPESESAAAGHFVNGVVIARIPLFLFQAVQAALLPRLARLAARGDFVEFRAGLRRLLTLVAVIGVIGTLGALILGAPIVDLVYGADLSGRTMAMLALSSAIYMGAIATSQAVVALHGHAQVAFGWILAMTTFLLALWVGGDDLFRRIEIALVLSSLTALVAFSVALKWRFSIVQPATAGDAGPLPELPLET